jgi:hypothetical protein
MLNPRTALLAAGEELSTELRRELLAAGREVLPALHEVLLDRSLVAEDSPGEGWAPIHAAELLGALAAPESAGPLLSVFADADWMETIKEESLQALQAIGAPVIELALLALAAAPLEEQREDFCTVLAGLGVRDERIFTALLAQLPRSPSTVATCLAT